MSNFNISIEEYMNISSNFDANFENYEVCETLLLPVEEGIMNKIGTGIKKIYEKFHKIFTDFKNWVKRIIKRIRSFFKKDEENVDTEKAKEDISKVEDVLKTAEGVDKDLADALYAKGPKRDNEVSSFNYSEEYQNKADEMRELKKKADESVSEMKEVKETVSKTYLLPETTEAGDKERARKAKYAEYQRKGKDDYEWKTFDDASDNIEEMIKKYLKTNPFGSKNRQATYTYESRIVDSSECLKNKINRHTLKPIKLVNTGAREVGNVMHSVAEIVRCKEFDAAIKAYQYAISKIPNLYVKAYIQNNRSEYERVKNMKEPENLDLYYRSLFVLNPSSASLNEFINKWKSEESD